MTRRLVSPMIPVNAVGSQRQYREFGQETLPPSYRHSEQLILIGLTFAPFNTSADVGTISNISIYSVTASQVSFECG